MHRFLNKLWITRCLFPVRLEGKGTFKESEISYVGEGLCRLEEQATAAKQRCSVRREETCGNDEAIANDI